MSQTPRKYPVPCAKCGEEKGFPYHVRTLSEKPGHIEVKLRCRDCGHEWVEVMSSNDNL